MGFWAAIPVLGKLIEGIGGAIDRNVTSDDERLQAKAKLAEFHASIIGELLAAEKMYLQAQMEVMRAELSDGNTLTKSWRPIAMLCFLSLVMWYAIGTAFDIPVPSEAVIDQSMGLVKLGLGGYIIGRSGEKMVTRVVGALKKKEEI